TGFAGGLFFMYQFSDMFAIQPEAYYTMKGATDNGTIEGYSYDAEMKLDYIEVPLLLKFLIPIKDSGVKPAIFAGPSIGFNMSAKTKVEAGGQTFEQDMEDVASTDFGLVFGGGVGFPVGNGELGLDIRYILGLSTIDDSAAKADVKNGVINFNLYYGFNLK
ncbi:MAG TPA: porin family protein, partial [Ignavibacteriaceae bacterium]